MKANRKTSRLAAVEILPTVVRLAILEPRDDGQIHVQTVSHVWRQQATSLATDEGRLELAAALRQLAQQNRLANVPLFVALSGDFCVTRVITGLNDEVRRELLEVEQRSNLYLSLGHGQKATSSCVTAIDARHQRALLAVANDRVLTAVTDAIQRAGLHAQIVEPALVSLCRLLGRTGVDEQNPVLIVRGDERGVEVGISFGGQLLLDYRPAARQAREQAGEIIGSHMHRLRRYCGRYVRVASGQLSSLFVSGDRELCAMVCEGLSTSDFSVRPLAPNDWDQKWHLNDTTNAPEFAAAIGAALHGLPTATMLPSVNLIDRRHMRAGNALLPTLLRALWPVAAVLLLALVGLGFMQWEQLRLSGLQADFASLAVRQAEARQLRSRTLSDRREAEQLERIAQLVRGSHWDELTAHISQCMPEDVWLDELKVDAAGRIQLVGASFTEDGVFEFVRWLEKIPSLKHVALSGTRPTRVDLGPATQFDVRCDFNDASGRKEDSHDRG